MPPFTPNTIENTMLHCCCALFPLDIGLLLNMSKNVFVQAEISLLLCSLKTLENNFNISSRFSTLYLAQQNRVFEKSFCKENSRNICKYVMYVVCSYTECNRWHKTFSTLFFIGAQTGPIFVDHPLLIATYRKLLLYHCSRV